MGHLCEFFFHSFIFAQHNCTIECSENSKGEGEKGCVEEEAHYNNGVVLAKGRKQQSTKNRGINKALHVTEGGGKALKEGGARKLPRFLYLKALEPFISNDLRVRVTNPIEYITLSGSTAFGTPADVMGDICQVTKVSHFLKPKIAF